jgi:predicted nucleic acid-binding protein
LILYLDTSSLVKLYIEETHSNLVKKWVRGAEIASTCRIAYPEAISAFNRRFKSGDLVKSEYDVVLKSFSKEWLSFAVIDFDEIEAGQLVQKYGLRGFDAVHLSSAKLIKKQQNGVSLSFSSFDEKLNSAAAAEGLAVLSPHL